jgi:hypothetical protein
MLSKRWIDFLEKPSGNNPPVMARVIYGLVDPNFFVAGDPCFPVVGLLVDPQVDCFLLLKC